MTYQILHHHPSHMITPFLSLSLHLFLHPYPLTTLTFPNPLPSRLSSRDKHPPTYLHDYHCFLTLTIVTTSTNVWYPLHSVLSYSRLSSSYRHFIMSIFVSTEPTSYAEASHHDCWLKAMQVELHVLLDRWSSSCLFFLYFFSLSLSLC